MTDSIPPLDAAPQPPQKTSLYVRAWLVVLGAALVASCGLNVLTLANSSMHARAYGLLEKFASTPAALKVASGLFQQNLLANSLVSRQRQEIDASVGALRARNLELVGATRVLVDKTTRLLAEKKAQDMAFVTLAKNHATLTKLHEVQTVAARKLATNAALRATRGMTRNLRTVAGKAVPLVGTALTIAGTSYDVYDACNALREVNEFEAATGGSAHALRTACGFHLPGR